ncbi:DUF1092 family protein [Synechococcales cyanobacterium C]|uniref:DUF1092 family protein n=1 Tax=Petrachloros mirabilis ULC683 TaxID=2781853 RepID=A0A8K2A1M4_9CYAN|nr:Tab2/Atab2 family RNA-binding protein [Petrachloros mirabilis]NCJ08173.1 DUF1092 family protein [Petrachloros mirabilis ULC683]
MSIWQVDFYRRPLQDGQGNSLWELVICSPDLRDSVIAYCPQEMATAAWLKTQLQTAIAQASQPPTTIQVFRPQTLNLMVPVCETLQIPVVPTRRTVALKQLLKERSQLYPQMPEYTGRDEDPCHLEQPPPEPIPEQLWGEQWQFVTLSAQDLEMGLLTRTIPVKVAPADLTPSHLGLSLSTRVPGVVIYGGRQSMPLTRWLQQQNPVYLQGIQGSPSGLVLAAGLNQRWILVTYEDPEVIEAAQAFMRRQQASQGLHFLLVQPDDSGVTFSGLWLLAP